MDHECSVKIMAVEKYLLGEFGEADRRDFERHYFTCDICGEDVRLAFEFKEIATDIFLEERLRPLRIARPAAPKRWFAWLSPAAMAPVAASVAMAVWGGYVSLVQMPALRGRLQELSQPQAFQSTFVVPPSSRGEVPAISRTSGFLPPLTLAIGVVPPAERYECQVRSAATGKVQFRIPVSKLESDANLTLTIPAAAIEPGRYEAVLLATSGGSTAEIDHYPFVVRAQ